MLDRCGWTLRLGSLDASCVPGSARFRAQQALTPYTAVVVVAAAAASAGVAAAAAAAAATATAAAIAAVAAANVCRWLHPSQHALPPHCYFLQSRVPCKTLQHKAADRLA